MLMNPRTNDPVLQAVAVGNFAKNLDSLEVRSEIERWSVVRLATVADLLLKRGQRLLEYVRLPGRYASGPADYQLGPSALISRRSWRSEHRR